MFLALSASPQLRVVAKASNGKNGLKFVAVTEHILG